MKVKRLICPVCKKEEVLEKTEVDNLHEYSEELITQFCPECSDTAEARLLAAIFGKTDEPSLWLK